jgi:ferritin-like metal-binding protein YciE
MPETPVRDAKLVQYLNEAYAKEKELELSLQAHIGMTTLSSRKSYKKRLQDHLKETKSHAKELERRIKKLGGGPGALVSPRSTLATGAGKAAAVVKGQAAAAKGPMHALRGMSDEEKLLKNAKTEYFNEHEEIATYAAIETLAAEVGDAETAKLARSIRRDEERMARYLEKLIPTLTKAVAKTEIPTAERRNGARSGGSRKRTSSRSSRRSGGTRKRTTSSRRTRAKTGSRS